MAKKKKKKITKKEKPETTPQANFAALVGALADSVYTEKNDGSGVGQLDIPWQVWSDIEDLANELLGHGLNVEELEDGGFVVSEPKKSKKKTTKRRRPKRTPLSVQD